MAKPTRQHVGLILLVGALLLYWALQQAPGNEARATAPPYDGAANTFTLTIQNTATKAEVDDLYWAEVIITNSGAIDGRMMVQCSLLDEVTHPFLSDLLDAQRQGTSVTKLPQEGNCVATESSTQTAVVTLAPKATTTVNFTMTVPKVNYNQNVLYCAAYERCAASGVDPLESAAVVKPVTITVDDGNPANNNKERYGSDCTQNSDCRTLGFWGNQVCDQGYCMAAPGGTEETSWISEHKSTLLLLAVVCAVLAIFYLYRKPKQPVMYQGGYLP